jgi:hypothetical protein
MKKSFLTFNLLFVLTLFFSVSCSDDSQEMIDDIFNAENTETTVQAKNTVCDVVSVSGTNVVAPGGTIMLRYDSDLGVTTPVTWTVLSGDLTKISERRNSATFQAGSNFTSGEVKALGDNGHLECSDNFLLTTGTPPTPDVCPTDMVLNTSDYCLDFSATLFDTQDVDKVDWYYSISTISNQHFGTTSPLPGYNYMVKQLTVPNDRDWDNGDTYYLVIRAAITLNDGSTCSITKNLHVTFSHCIWEFGGIE